jgi:hypothetical protein
MGKREAPQFKCTICGQVGTVGRCCGKETREPLNEAAKLEKARDTEAAVAGEGAMDKLARLELLVNRAENQVRVLYTERDSWRARAEWAERVRRRAVQKARRKHNEVKRLRELCEKSYEEGWCTGTEGYEDPFGSVRTGSLLGDWDQSDAKKALDPCKSIGG